jgi:hypothetical protein
MIDYLLKSPASSVTLEIFDAQPETRHKFSSEDRKHPEKHPPLPIAERWFPKPEPSKQLPDCIALSGTLPGAVREEAA